VCSVKFTVDCVLFVGNGALNVCFDTTLHNKKEENGTRKTPVHITGMTPDINGTSWRILNFLYYFQAQNLVSVCLSNNQSISFFLSLSLSLLLKMCAHCLILLFTSSSFSVSISKFSQLALFSYACSDCFSVATNPIYTFCHFAAYPRSRVPLGRTFSTPPSNMHRMAFFMYSCP
jgi:hypothetical protein